MAYTHQRDELVFLGTGNTAVILASSAVAAKARIVVHQKCVLRKVSAWSLPIGVTVAKPTFTIRKVTGPASSTATGTAITGGTLAFPATQPIGKLVVNESFHTTFDPGDHIVLQVSTAATKAFSTRVSAFVEPSWERPANTASKVSTVTA